MKISDRLIKYVEHKVWCHSQNSENETGQPNNSTLEEPETIRAKMKNIERGILHRLIVREVPGWYLSLAKLVIFSFSA